MSELGTRLREARVNKGYTLNTLQQMTKIQKKYLQAIEEGHLEELPGNFYARAFVKQYADMVGLDGDTLLREFESELEVQKADEKPIVEEEEELPSRLKERHMNADNNQIEKLLSYIPMFILSAIIICIILILLYAMRQLSTKENADIVTDNPASNVVEMVEPSQSTDDASTDETETSNTSQEKEELADNQIQVGKEVLTQISEEGQIRTYQLEGSLQNYTFGAKGLAFVWIGVYEDNAMVVDQTISKDENFEYQATQGTQTIRIELGYPEGAELQVNGIKIETDPYAPGTVIFQVNSDSDQSTQALSLGETTTEVSE